MSQVETVMPGVLATNSQRRPLVRAPGVLQPALIALAALIASAAAASGLVYPSSYAPLLVGAAIAAAVAMVVWFRRPVLALYVALFVVFLPIGLIPPSIHSILNRSLTMIALTTWLFGVVTGRRTIAWASASLPMVGFLIWGGVTLFWAHDFTIGVDTLQIYALRFILFLLLVPNLIRKRRDVDGLMNSLALVGWVLVAAAAGTVLLQGYAPDSRFKVLGMNENEVGIVALITLIGVLWSTMHPSTPYRELRTLMAWVFLFVTIALVGISGSRGSAISLLVVLVAFCFWMPTRRWGALGLLILAFGIVGAPLLFSTTLDRLAVMRDDTMLGGREDLWRAGWQLISQYPWGGVGIGNAPTAVLPLVQPLRSIWGLARVPLHNPILTIWGETGIVGLILYLGVLASAVWSFVRKFRSYAIAGSRLPWAYFALVVSLLLGFMTSWVKGGGMESDFSYFLLLALLMIPAHVGGAVSPKQQLPATKSHGLSDLGMKYRDVRP